MTDRVCPEDGHPMIRGTRAMTIKHKGRSTEIEMPGWYCDECDEGIHTGQDMAVSDEALHRLKAVAG